MVLSNQADNKVTKDVSAYLKAIPLFAFMSDLELQLVVPKMRFINFKKGMSLFSKGDDGDILYVIKSGIIKIYIISEEGEEFTLAILKPGDFFGEMSLIDGLPRSANAMCIEDSQLLALNRDDFYAVLKSNFNTVKAVLEGLSKRLRDTDELLADTCFLGATVRFAKRLVRLVEEHGRVEEGYHILDLSINQQGLGSMVGISRESVNKQLRLLKEKGILSIAEGKIKIKDLRELKRLAGNSP